MGGAVLGAVVSVVSASKQAKEQKKARKSQERASTAAAAERRQTENLRQQAANVSSQRARVQAVRQARIRRGQLETSAARTGTTGSSGAEGAESSIGSNIASNLGFSSFQQGVARDVSASNLRVADITTQGNIQTARHLESAATFGAIGGVGQSIFKDAGGFKTIFKAFT